MSHLAVFGDDGRMPVLFLHSYLGAWHRRDFEQGGCPRLLPGSVVLPSQKLGREELKPLYIALVIKRARKFDQASLQDGLLGCSWASVTWESDVVPVDTRDNSCRSV